MAEVHVRPYIPYMYIGPFILEFNLRLQGTDFVQQFKDKTLKVVHHALRANPACLLT